MRLVVFGAGAVGLSVAAWLAPHLPDLQILARGESAEALRRDGIRISTLGGDERRVPVQVITDLEAARSADAVLLAVKTYSLAAVARQVRDVLGDEVLAIGAQNGLENQQILPPILPRSIFCVVGYNAWRPAPGAVGFQKHGPLVLGGLTPALRQQAEALATIFDAGVPTSATDRIRDAAYCKMVINLTNSLTALAGLGERRLDSRDLLQQMLPMMLWEGVRIVRAAGVEEVRIDGMPAWGLLWAAANLPRWLTRPLFERNLKKMVVSSMGQDLARGGETELETINGALLALADEHDVGVPWLRSITALARERFAADTFEPMTVQQIWSAVAPRI